MSYDELEREVAEALAAGIDGATMELLDDATNLLGKLGPDPRARIAALLIEPSCETWNDAYSVIVNGNVGLGRTLWQAVLRVDDQCPTSGRPYRHGDEPTAEETWGGYFPDQVTVLLALDKAIGEG